jgi:hypothetical protein
MMRSALAIILPASTVVGAAVVLAQTDGAGRQVTIDQSVDQATLSRYHHTDQGTRLIPAAWLAAVQKADGSGPVMGATNLRALGFIIDDRQADRSNPYGWPIGFSVSDPSVSGGVPVAGFTCALCHTGQIEYKGTAIQIEGGQAYIDLPGFVTGLVAALAATARDPQRRQTFFADAIAAGYPADRMERDFESGVELFQKQTQATDGHTITQLRTGRGRLDAVQGIANQVFAADLNVPANTKDLDAPVNFPYLWDIWRLSWLQYNGFLPPQATSRNIGEVLGSRGRTYLVDAQTGALNPEPQRWRSSIQLNNINWMEKTLEGLRAPTWPADVLGPIDHAKATAGRALFGEHCAGCHGIKELPNGRWDVTVVPLTHIGTDSNQATHWAGRTYDASKLGLSSSTPAYDLDIAVNAIRRQLYADNNTPVPEQEPDVEFAAPCGYKARPLIGVWATPPFLHNGSVRTVYDLLSDTRPASFTFGSREYDPAHLGYMEADSPDPVVLDTSIPGNRNTGHWWTDEANRPGRIGPRLAEGEKYAIIEYLKAASYENYPSMKVSEPASLPCEGNKEWAR